MPDLFDTYVEGLESPASHLDTITPSDSTDLLQTTRAINVAGAGFVRVTTKEGDTGTVYVAEGGVFPIRATRIWATGTTATGIVGLS